RAEGRRAGCRVGDAAVGAVGAGAAHEDLVEVQPLGAAEHVAHVVAPHRDGGGAGAVGDEEDDVFRSRVRGRLRRGEGREEQRAEENDRAQSHVAGKLVEGAPTRYRIGTYFLHLLHDPFLKKCRRTRARCSIRSAASTTRSGTPSWRRRSRRRSTTSPP